MPALRHHVVGRTPLGHLGWNDQRAADFEAHATAGLIPGRVTCMAASAQAQVEGGLVEVVVQRRFRRTAASAADYPVVGDWLALQPLADATGVAALRAILPRLTVLARTDGNAERAGGHVGAQILAANVDVAFLVSAVGRDLNPRRIERYLLTCRAGGVQPVIVLNKADLASDLAGDLQSIALVAMDTPIVVVSALTGDGLEALTAHLRPGVTFCLMGSSGVGKSTISNALLGVERQAVRAARADDERGRHTTTRRELFTLPSGALLIDTPGLRAIGVWDDGHGLDEAFSDIEHVAERCRFRDCRHAGEPGCAVAEAVAAGELDAGHVEGMQKLAREIHSLELRRDVSAARAESRRLGRMYREAAKPAKRRGQADA